jgi:septum formation protein
MKLLRQDFMIDAVDIDETLELELSLPTAIERLAFRKALPIYKAHIDDVVIGADTVVVFNDQIFGKPKDHQEAYQMLRSLSGQTHQVITGVSIISKGSSISFHQITEVSFYPLSDQDIWGYINSEHILDKAGAYAIQEGAAKFVSHIQGDFFNIVGLPVGRLAQELNKIK